MLKLICLLCKNLAKLKAEVDKIYANKLKTVSVDLNKLSNIVNNEAAKNSVYDKMVVKVKNIDTIRFVLETKCDTDKYDL